MYIVVRDQGEYSDRKVDVLFATSDKEIAIAIARDAFNYEIERVITSRMEWVRWGNMVSASDISAIQAAIVQIPPCNNYEVCLRIQEDTKVENAYVVDDVKYYVYKRVIGQYKAIVDRVIS